MSIAGIVRRYCPDIKWIRDILKWAKIRDLGKTSLSEEQLTAGEADEAERDRLVEQCRQKWGKEYGAFEKDYAAFSASFKPIVEKYGEDFIRKDCFFCHFGYGFSAGEYFAFKLYEKDSRTRRTYVTDLYRQKMSYYMNDIIEMEVFFDKYKTSKKYAQYYKRETMFAGSEQDLDTFKAFVSRHGSFVVKPYQLSRGRGVRLIESPKGDAEAEAMFADLISDGKKILEEPIVQGDVLGAFHPGSVNTIRCVAIARDGQLHIPYCIIRMGRGNSFVDNASAGGVFAIIDPENGEIVSDGTDESNNVYVEHPDTHIHFKGYRIPQWDTFMAFIREIAFYNPKIRYVGWDIAYGRDKGWMIVEGNCTCQLEARQVACGHGMKKEFDAIIGRVL